MIAKVREVMQGRPFLFIFLAFALAFANTFTTTTAASSFLANAGAERLPLYYLLFSVISIPLSVAFSGVIDRWPRRRLFVAMLGGLVAEGVALPQLPRLIDPVAAEFLAYIGFSVLELLLYSVYYVLFADYFTATQANRHTNSVAMGMAMGGIAGAAMVGGLAMVAPAGTANVIMPALAGLVLLYALWLTRREEPLDETESGADEGMWESLRILPKVASRYPIIGFMAAAVFLNILLQCMAEYAAFSIYAEHYPDENALTAFLGFANAGINVLGVAIVLAFTNPLLPRLGVARMNLCVPLFNIVSFGLLSVSPSLPAGVLSHVNYDSFENNAGVPVFAMNYNAIPHRFVGRVRVVNDGIVYPLALAVSGMLLMAITGLVALPVLAAACVGLSLVFLAVAWGIKRHYVRGLLAMLRDGSIDFDQAGKGFVLPPEYLDDVRSMLTSPEPDTVFLGLEMALRCDAATAFASAGDGLARLSPEQGRLILGTMAEADRERTVKLLWHLSRAHHDPVRRLALAFLGARRLPLSGCDLPALRRDGDEIVRAMADLLAEGQPPAQPDTLPAHAAQAIIAICPSLDKAAAVRVLHSFHGHPDPAVRAAALDSAGGMAAAGDPLVMPWARAAAVSPQAEIRAAALSALIRLSSAERLEDLAAAGLRDPARNVRHAAAHALGRRGDEALAAVAAQLRPAFPVACHAAMEALGRIGGKGAGEALFAFLAQSVFPQVEQALALLKRVPATSAEWRALRTAMEDVNVQAVALVLSGLDAMGYRRILGSVRSALRASDARVKANAIEALSSLAHRRYVLPLVPLLERGDDDDTPPPPEDGEARHILTQGLAMNSPWVRAAALAVWHALWRDLPPATDDDPDAVLTTRRLLESGEARDDKDLPMNRLAFLKSVSLFADMTLNHLVALDGAMARDTYLPGEAIVTEGDTGDRLYVIFRGQVAISKRFPDGERELARLSAGQIFGEMSVFDCETRSATVTAIEETEVLSLGQEHLHSLIRQRPEISVELCKVLARRLRHAIS